MRKGTKAKPTAKEVKGKNEDWSKLEMRLGKWGAMKIKRICQIDRQTDQSADVGLAWWNDDRMIG